MASFFKANEIIQAAVEIETKGEAMYTKLMDRAEGEFVKKTFEFLRDEEKRHKALFSDMLSQLGDIELPAGSNQEEYASYLTDLINTHVLIGGSRNGNWGENVQDRLKTDEDALRFAMQFERDTILFFMEMEKMVPDTEKTKVQACADEERRHLRKLASMFDSLV